MRFFVGDETGLLKRLQITSDEDNGGAKCVVTKWRKQDRAEAITAIHLRKLEINQEHEQEQQPEELLLGLKSGVVESFRPASEDAPSVVKGMETKSVPIVGLYGDDNRIVVGYSSGEVVTHRRSGGSKKKGKNSINSTLIAAPDANCMEVCKDTTNKFAIAGKEYDPRIWDLNSSDAPVFKAKNVKPDKLLLQEPRNVNVISFVPSTDGTQFVTGTTQHKLRFYDSKAQNRPVYSVELGDSAIKSLAVSPDGTTVVVGDVIGDMYSCDLRTGRTIGKFRGLSGSCRDLHYYSNPKRPLVACCGLDRHVRLYDAKTRKGKFSHYLKQSLTCMAFADSGYGNEFETVKRETDKQEKKRKSKESKQEEADDDELWDSLESSKRSKKTQE